MLKENKHYPNKKENKNSHKRTILKINISKKKTEKENKISKKKTSAFDVVFHHNTPYG